MCVQFTSCVYGLVVGIDTLVLAVSVDTEILEVNVPSPSTIDTGWYPDVIATGAETIGGKSNANLVLFFFPGHDFSN